MNIKRAFLIAVAVLMVPGFAMAQSTHIFPTTVYALGGPDALEVTATCNSGIPLSQPGTTPVTFTVTEVLANTSCNVVVTGDVPAGWDIDYYDAAGATDADACVFDAAEMGSATTHVCSIYLTKSPVDFEVMVSWDIADEAHEGVGDGAMLMMMCYGDDNTSTSYPASPADVAAHVDEDDMPLPYVLEVTPTSTCNAYLTGVGSAVEVSSTCNDVAITMDMEEGDNECAIVATAFYEGIPTLSQYGMAIMVLLMLGVGFVGFRRFV